MADLYAAHRLFFAKQMRYWEEEERRSLARVHEILTISAASAAFLAMAKEAVSQAVGQAGKDLGKDLKKLIGESWRPLRGTLTRWLLTREERANGGRGETKTGWRREAPSDRSQTVRQLPYPVPKRMRPL